jgi:predicted lipoprotein with Yx(FWY)xxD motif
LKRTVLTLAALAVLAFAAVAVARSSHGATVKVRSTDIGKIVVNRRGFTMYVFSRDRRGHEACVNIAGCTTIWPPLTTKSRPVAGKGIKRALLGTIKLPNGQKQVTYAGWPLYGYITDTQPGETSYVGVNQSGGRWYAITPSGKLKK